MTSLDRIDRQIVGLLQADARRSVKAISEAAGIASSTCLDRIRALEAKGVIRGYHADVDLAALGRTLQAVLAVRLSPKTPQIIERFIEHVWSLPETLAVTLLSGDTDVEIHLAVGDSDHLRKTVLNAVASFPGVVDERTSIVFEERRKSVLEPI